MICSLANSNFSDSDTTAEQKAKKVELEEQVRRINVGEEELIPWEDVRKTLEETRS